MAEEPTTPRTQQGESEELGTQAGDSQSPGRQPQHQQGDGNNLKPIIRDWASI